MPCRKCIFVWHVAFLDLKIEDILTLQGDMKLRKTWLRLIKDDFDCGGDCDRDSDYDVNDDDDDDDDDLRDHDNDDDDDDGD